MQTKVDFNMYTVPKIIQPNNLDSIFKSRDITLPTKVRLVKAMVFPVIMYGCESWTVKKAERWRIDAFKLWCWEDCWESFGLQGDPASPFWRRSTLGFLWKEWCWSWSSNTLATSWEELTPWKRPWCWEGLRAGGEGNDRGWDGWTASLMWWTWVWIGDGQGILICCSPWGCKDSDTTELLNWTDLIGRDQCNHKGVIRSQEGQGL